MDPAELNWCPERIDSLYQLLEEKDTKGFIILKDGRIVLERYFGTFTQDSIWYWASAGKSLAAFLVGMAQEQGLLDIQDPVNQYLGNGWTSCTPEQEDAIRIRHQITMTTGLDERNVDLDCMDPSCLKYRVDPGTRWYYHNAPYRLVQDVVAAASGMSFQQYTIEQLRSRIGLSGLWFNRVFYSTPRTMARFGLLMLAGGDWDGQPVMMDKAYFSEMINTSQPHNESYGYLWWLNGKASFQLPGLPLKIPGELIESAPDDLFAGLGKNDQKVYVVPSQGLVVIRMGNKAGDIPVASLSSFDDLLWERISALECQPTGTGERARASGTAWPNPFSDQINLTGIDGPGQWNILDLSGKIVASGALPVFNISTGQMASGVYVIRCIAADGQVLFQQRMIRQ